MLTRLIGDVHGKYDRYETILRKSPYHTIQVGDMGVGFFRWPLGEPVANPPFDAMAKGNHRFIRGNHDNPEQCKKHKQWIPDGSIINGTMFIGGAESIDRPSRVEGYSWWPTEELSYEEFGPLLALYIEKRPRVMITHDCPQTVAAQGIHPLLPSGGYPMDSTRTRKMLQHMWSVHSPELWVFGHWHTSFDYVLNGTRFVCLAELEHKDFDI